MKRSRERSSIPPSEQQRGTPSGRIPISTVDEAVACLATEKTNDSKGRERIHHSILLIEHKSVEVGLPPNSILSLIKIIESRRLAVKNNIKLIKSLVPQQYVPEEALITIVSFISSNHLSDKVEIELLKWVTNVLNFVRPMETFPCFYGILFNFLRYNSLVPVLCRLLCKLTKKQHVLKFRIEILKETQQRMGSHRHIVALLGVFACHRPDLLTVKSKANLSSFYRSLDVLPPSLEKLRGGEFDGKHFYNTCTFPHQAPISEDLSDFHSLCDVMENLKGNKGLAKLLTSPNRYLLFTAGLPEPVLAHFCSWLAHRLSEEVSVNKKDYLDKTVYPNRSDVLLLVCDLCEELQEGIPEADDFVKFFLKRWDGKTHFDSLMEIIPYMQMIPFATLLNTVLVPIFKHFCASTVTYKCHILQCYTDLYRRWVLFEVKRLESFRMGNQEEETVTSRKKTTKVKNAQGAEKANAQADSKITHKPRSPKRVKKGNSNVNSQQQSSANLIPTRRSPRNVNKDKNPNEEISVQSNVEKVDSAVKVVKKGSEATTSRRSARNVNKDCPDGQAENVAQENLGEEMSIVATKHRHVGFSVSKRVDGRSRKSVQKDNPKEKKAKHRQRNATEGGSKVKAQKKKLKIKYRTVFPRQDIGCDDPYHEIQRLLTYIETMCITALQLHPNHPPILMQHILRFIEVMISVSAVDMKAPILQISPFILRTALFSYNSNDLSGLCKIFVSLKHLLVRRKTSAQLVPGSLISWFNGSLLDLCNTLWRQQAFVCDEKSLLFTKELPLSLQQSVYSTRTLFSLHRHPALMQRVVEFLGKPGQGPGAISRLITNSDLREVFFKHLEHTGMENVVAFIKTFINLM